MARLKTAGGIRTSNKLNGSLLQWHLRYLAVNIKLYIEVSKPRIVLVLVITAVASALAVTRFDIRRIQDGMSFHGICYSSL